MNNFIKANQNLITKMTTDVANFNRLIVGYPIPNKPELMSKDRANFRANFMQEELNEFLLANSNQDLEGAVDAIIDLIYVAVGAINEMGVLIQPIWDEVHKANMKKICGSIPKKLGNKDLDAIKPEGREYPSHTEYLKITSEDIKLLLALKKHKFLKVISDSETKTVHGNRAKPIADKKSKQGINTFNEKIIILGYAGHGKDTVCELLANKYGLAFTSSSRFCAEQVIFPILKDKYGYKNVKDCYNDRSNHRAEWFDIISSYNTPDKTKLGFELFKTNDVYCGIRNASEFHALKNSGIFKWAIWVDASGRGIPIEDKTSCNVEPWMADFHLYNDGSIEDLEYNIDQLVLNIFYPKKSGSN